MNAEFDKLPQSEAKQNQVRLINKKSALEHLNNTYHTLLQKAFSVGTSKFFENVNAEAGKYYLMGCSVVDGA